MKDKKYNIFIYIFDKTKLINNIMGKEAKVASFSALGITKNKIEKIKSFIKTLYNINSNSNLDISLEVFDLEYLYGVSNSNG